MKSAAKVTAGSQTEKFLLYSVSYHASLGLDVMRMMKSSESRLHIY